MTSRLDQRSQSGYMLVATLSLLLLITVVAAAVLAMTTTALRVTNQYRSNARQVTAADSGLESVLNTIRRDGDPGATGAGVCPDHDQDLGTGHYRYELSFTLPPDDVVVDVDVDCLMTMTASGRDVTLTAVVDGRSDPSGTARALITDSSGAGGPGVAVAVCDWQLGQVVSTPSAECGTSG